MGARRILICNQGWHAETPSGANRLSSDIAIALAGQGHEVHYLTIAEAGPYDEPVLSDGVHVWRHPPAPAEASGLDKLRHHLGASEALAQRIGERVAIDLIYGHTHLQYAGALKGLHKAGRQPKAVFAVHSPYAMEMAYKDEASESRPWMRTLRQGIYRIIERRLIARSDAVHGFSTYTGDCLRSLHGRRALKNYQALPAWVDLEHFQPTAPLDLRQVVGGPCQPGETVFFTLRRLQPRMGLERLIDAAHQLAKEGHAFRLLIGGSGPMRQALLDRIALHDLTERVHLLGRLPDEDVTRLYSTADCFVLPTRGLECFGLIVLEAWACGRPVIATPVGAIPELFVADGWNREWLTAGTEPHDIAARLRAFMEGKITPPPPEVFRARAAQWSREVRLPVLLDYVLGV